MLPGYAADSAARSRADRAIAVVGRLAAGLTGALGVASPLHWHLVGQPASGPHLLGGAWVLTGIAAWCSGAHRRTPALTVGALALLSGLAAGLTRAASPLEALAVCVAAAAVLLHDRDVNAPPSDVIGYIAVGLVAIGTAGVGAALTGVPLPLGWVGPLSGYPRLALATLSAGIAIGVIAWLDVRRAQPGGPRWFAALTGVTASTVSVLLWLALRSREIGL